MEYNSNYRTGMPPQKISSKLKNEAWMKANVDAIINMSSDTGKFGRPTREQMQINYDLVNSIFNERDFKYLTNPANIEDNSLGDLGGMPTLLRLHNIIRPKLELLKGEEARRPFNWIVIGEDGEIINEKMESKRMDILQSLQSMAAAALGTGEEIPLEQIEQKHRVQGTDVRERNSARLLMKIWRDQNLKQKFSKGFTHASTSAVEVYYVSKHDGKPICRTVNPMYFDFDKNPDLDFIQEGNWAKEERLMSTSSIVDEHDLKDTDIARLDNGEVSSSNSPFGYDGSDYLPIAINEIPGGNLGTEYNDFGRPDKSNFTPDRPFSSHTSNKVLVTTVVWRSLRKVGFLTAPDGSTEFIDNDAFVLTQEMKRKGFTLEWEWITDIWKGTRIGADIYTDMGPLENQNGKLPYVGYVYNNINSRATSLVDMVKQHQYTYMEVWYKLMMELAKAKGKKIIMDTAQIPSDMPKDRWLYYYDVVGILWINSMEEGEGVFAGKQPQFNQFQTLDQSISSSINNYILMLNKIEDMIGDVLGVSPQREGAIASSETVGGVERSVNQSSLITEPFFIQHNEVKKHVLSQLLDMALLCVLEDDSPIQLVIDDGFREMIKIDGKQLNDSRYKLEITDASEDYAMLEKLKGLAQAALQNEAASLSELAKLYKSKSGAEVVASFKRWEDERDARNQQQAQQQQELDKERLAKEEQRYYAELEYKAEKDRLDRETQIQVATISALRGKDGPSDMNMNGVPDPMEAGKQALEMARFEHEKLIEQIRIGMEGKKTEMDAQEKAIKVQSEAQKMEIEKEKLSLDKYKADLDYAKFQREQDQQDKQNQVDAKEKEKDRQLKKTELDKKAQIEKYKIKNKPKPKAPAKKAATKTKKK